MTTFNGVESKFVKLADLKTYSMFLLLSCLSVVWFLGRRHTLPHTASAVASLHTSVQYNTPKQFLCFDTHQPNVKTNRLLQEVMRGALGMKSVCWMCCTSLLALRGERCITEKKDGILTSTLNTFRKKLLCRCLVLVFTTVRFQSAMLGKCFSFL